MKHENYIQVKEMFDNVHHNPHTKTIGTVHTELVHKFGVGFVMYYNYKGKLLKIDILHDNEEVTIFE